MKTIGRFARFERRERESRSCFLRYHLEDYLFFFFETLKQLFKEVPLNI